MGLDVMFYERIEKIGPHATEWVDDDGNPHSCWDDLDHEQASLWPDGTFAFTQRGLDNDFHFTPSGQRERVSFTYSFYSVWRAALLALVRPDLSTGRRRFDGEWFTWYEDGLDDLSDAEFEALPFAELIGFADNEGSYTGGVAAELLGDFNDYADRLDEFGSIFPGSQPQLLAYYRKYQAGLAIVGVDGLVDYR